MSNIRLKKSEEKTLKRIELVERSINIWEDYMKGKIDRKQYQLLQETTLEKIRRLKDGKKGGAKK